jgi:hypothetical protein
MSRREFSRDIKVAVIKRATQNSVVYCEQCGALAKKWQIDHRRADGLLGEPTLENAQLLGTCCYEPKNAQDTRDIARAKRLEARHFGIKTKHKTPKTQRPLKTAAGQTELQRRYGITGDEP